MAKNDDGKIYSATYSNVPVYELNVDSNHVMRRRQDNWINATHILKVADYDKPARTRILEREVQKGVHEKVQGGYGKYQGTWIPLEDGVELAAKNGVYEKLRPIFEFVPGDRSPPPAPKHATAASSKPRVPRAAPQPRRQPVQMPVDYDAMDHRHRDDETPDNLTVVSESAYDDYDQSQYTNSRKRRRAEDTMTQAEKDHQLWAEELLDYFMLQDSPLDSPSIPPPPPANANLDRPIDEKGYTALHWAAAMGDVEVVKDLIRRGAHIAAQAKNGETPLMRSVIFTNSHDKGNMEKLAPLLIRTVNMQEWYGSTVFHHIANATQRKSKYGCARYYMDCLLNKMAEILPPDDIEAILNQQDRSGDTAVTIAARHGARKCVRSLLGRNAAVDIANNNGETADSLIVQLNQRRQERANDRRGSSSPFQGDSIHGAGGSVQPVNGANGFSFNPMRSMNGGASHGIGSSPDVYKSEAALGISSQVIPMILDKANSLASNIDKEIETKNNEVLEAEDLARRRRDELATLRKQQEELRRKEHEQMSGGTGTDGPLQQEADDLKQESKSVEERDQSFTLHDQYGTFSANGNNQDAMAIDDEEDGLPLTPVDVSREVLELKDGRFRVVDDILTNMSVAGLPHHQNSYKRLICGALGVQDEDLERILPDIAMELEDARGMEAVGA